MAPQAQQEKLKSYYQWHAPIYDASRWSFLFGRQNLIKQCQRIKPGAGQILEIGCGTGKNLQTLRNHFPSSQISGCDLSKDMLNRAAEKFSNDHQLRLKEGDYIAAPTESDQYDLILFSYILTMTPEQFEAMIHKAYQELHPGGLIAIVDFYSSPFLLFRRWMAKNHVRLNHRWDMRLERTFTVHQLKKIPAYAGIWNYFQFIGSKPSSHDTSSLA